MYDPAQQGCKLGHDTSYIEKRKRIKAGSGEKMRKVGSKGAPTAKSFKDAKKTAKKFPL